MDWNDLGRFYGIESANSSKDFKKKVCEKFQITEPFLFTLYEILDLTKERVGFKITDEVKSLISSVEKLPETRSKKSSLDVKGNPSVLRLLKETASEINSITKMSKSINFHHNKKDFVISFQGKPTIRFEKIDRYEYQFLYGNVVLQGVGQNIVDQIKSGSNFKKLKNKWVLIRVTDKVLIQIIRELNDIRFFETE